MNEDLKARYDFASWGQDRQAAHVLLRGYKPWREDALDWRPEARHQLPEPDQRRLRRSFWSPPEDPERLVLIEVRETPSSSAAMACLLDVLGQNDHVRLPGGPAEIGDVCFIHPDEETPGVFWTTGNECVSLLSLGGKPAPVLKWAQRLHARMSTRPHVTEHALTIEPPRGLLAPGERSQVIVAWPSIETEEGFYQVFSDEAELSLEDDQIRILTPSSGPVAVEAFVVEPNRPTIAGLFESTVS